MAYNYALFVLEGYGASGGWDDLVGIFETVEEAMEKGRGLCSKSHDAHIVHLMERRIVLRGQWRQIHSTLTGQAATRFFAWTSASEEE
jgi:hypothetical protein